MTSWAKKTIIMILCIETIFFIAPKLFFQYQPGAILVGLLGDLTNQQRESENLSPLKENAILNEAAKQKADDMAMYGYFAHTSPEGKTPWYWLDLVGYKYDYAGENLAINFSDTEDVTTAWMKSPTHRANIIKRQYTEMGSAIATGTYQGRESTFIVQVYANPRKEIAVAKATDTDPESEKIEEFVNNDEDIQVLGASIEDAKITNENLKSNIVPKKVEVFDLIVMVSLYILGIGLIINLFLRWNFRHHNHVNGALMVGILILFLILFNDNIGKEIYINSIDYAESQTY